MSRDAAVRAWLRPIALAALLCAGAALAACGGGSGGSGSGSKPSPDTLAGTYTITVTGTAGKLSHATQLTLTVN